MSAPATSKLNRLLQAIPKGAVVTTPRLLELGVSPQLARKYIDSGWLTRLGHGAFARAGDQTDWAGGLWALQKGLGLSVHVAGRTALELLGRSHYVLLGVNQEITLVSDGREQLPAWFTRQPWAARVMHRCVSLFEVIADEAASSLDCGDFMVTASSPERAIVEAMHLATGNPQVAHACLLMDGLNTLRPAVVQVLLEGCRSVKAKRLFLWSAETAGHAWVDSLDLGPIDLGRGKRQIYQVGKLDRKYQITVPPHEDMPGV